MNCRMAICAVASCMATRSGRKASVALPALQRLARGIVEVPEEDLLGQGQRPPQPVAHHGQPLPHAPVDLLHHFPRGFDRHDQDPPLGLRWPGTARNGRARHCAAAGPLAEVDRRRPF